MIGFLRGKLQAKYAAEILLDVGGVGYEVHLPMSTFSELPAPGQEVALYTHLIVREDAQTLFGFASEQERALFRSLIRISGIGARLAVTILSGISVSDFVETVRVEDTGRLVKLPGIGKKTAERLIVEMRDKLGKSDSPMSTAPRSGSSTPRSEAHSALLALGYKNVEVNRLLDKVDTQDRSAADIIRDALKAS